MLPYNVSVSTYPEGGTIEMARDYSFTKVKGHKQNGTRQSPYNKLWREIVAAIPVSESDSELVCAQFNVDNQKDGNLLRGGLKRAAKKANNLVGLQIVGATYPKVLQVWRPMSDSTKSD